VKVVITGAGVLSSLGIGARPSFESMLTGRTNVGGEVPGFEPAAFLGTKGIRHFDRTALLLASAARLALDESGFARAGYAPEETGVVVGSTHGSIQAIAEFDQEAVREGPSYVNPQDFANTVINAPASRVAMLFGPTGLNATIASGTASVLDALGYALSMLRLGRVRAVLCGGALGSSREIARSYERAGKLVPPPDGCIPFALRRRGAALAEGAAVFVLEEQERALSRGVQPLATVAAVGTAFSGGPTGPARAMQEALALTGLPPARISCVVSSASGDPRGDREEGEAIGRILGAVPVTAPKSFTGDCLEVSGAIGIAVAVLAIRSGKIPPIARLDEVDPGFSGLDLVRGMPRRTSVRHVLVNARDDSGHCASAVVSEVA